MATNVSPSELPCATSCPLKDTVAYERIILDLEDRPDMKKEVEDAMDVLDYVMSVSYTHLTLPTTPYV